jgi:hypothetical protein
VNEQKLHRRMVRRSRYRSRSLLAIVVLTLVALVAIYVGIECVLAALAMPALLVTPGAALDASSIWLALIAVPGLLLIVLALVPGRRPRHELPDERMVVVVDDGVLAGAVKHAVLTTARVPADRVSSTVAFRRSSTRVVPTSGSPLDTAVLTASAQRLVESLAPKPSLKVDLRVSESGVVGS